MWKASSALWLLVLALRADADAFPCTEAGVLAAIDAGGGPHTFSCSGPTTIVTSAELVISQSVELDGGGLLALSGGNAHRVIGIPASPTTVATLRNLALRDGLAPGSTPGNGGCIYAQASSTLENVEISSCQGVGAIASEYADLTVIDSNIHGNQNGGISARAFNTSEHVLTITRTRVHANQVVGVTTVVPTFVTDSTIAGNHGNGIEVGGVWTGGYTLISRSTISHNVGGMGGLVVSGGYAEVMDSTFAGNLPVVVLDRQVSPPSDEANNVQIRNSTLVGNAGTAASTIRVEPCPPPLPHTDCWYAIIENTILSGQGFARSNGGNLFSSSCYAGMPSDRCVSAAELNLGKLGPHGGFTWTVPLKAPSVAIDGAPGCISATDQRGVARPQGAACDVGAFEWDGPAPGAVPALPWLGVAALLAALCLAGLWSLRGRRPG